MFEVDVFHPSLAQAARTTRTYDALASLFTPNNKKIVNVFGNVHPAENRQIGVEIFKRLTGWLKDGTIVVRALRATLKCH